MQISKLLSFIAVALLVSVIFAGLVIIPAAAETDNMQFRYDTAHTGDYSQVVGCAQPNGHLKWSYATGNFVDGSPTVANGVVYIGSGDDNVYALNASTGSVLWSYATANGVDSTPAVANGVVYIGSNNHNVYALNATTGSVLWNYTTGDFVISSPAVANGVVYVGSYDHNVYALNATTGAKLWNYTTGYGRVASSPAVANGVVYVGSADHNVYALNATTGAKLWNYTTGGAVFTSPAVANGVVYVGSYDHNVYALNATIGAKLWNYTTLNLLWSSPAYANGVVYIGGEDSIIYALNASTGSVLWSYATGGLMTSSPTVVDGTVYIGNSNSDIYAIDAALTQPIQLSLSVTNPTPTVGQAITFAGTLQTTGASSIRIDNASVSLQYSIDNINWSPASSYCATTNVQGTYAFEGAFLHPGTYYYRAYFAGTAQRNGAYSPVKKVIATSSNPTQLSITVTDSTPTGGQAITFSGTLQTTGASSIRIDNASVILQYATDGVNFASASSSPAHTTNVQGTYAFKGAFLHPGTYYYRAYYAGTAQYGSAYSPIIKIVVQ